MTDTIMLMLTGFPVVDPAALHAPSCNTQLRRSKADTPENHAGGGKLMTKRGVEQERTLDRKKNV